MTAASLVRHYPRHWGRPGPAGHRAAPAALRRPLPQPLARGFLPYLWCEHGGSIYGQHSLSLPQRQRQGPYRPAQVRPRLYLLPHRRYLYPYLPGGAPHRRCLGWALFGVIWALALAGLVLTLAWITAPRWLTAGIYIFMGWLAVVALVPLLRLLPPAGFFWVLGGGILYTVGGVLYAVKWPGRDNPRFGCHEIFHLFILMGSVFHFMLMYRVVAFL